MTQDELAIKFWEAADGITAFACAHTVAFLLSLLSKEAQEIAFKRKWITRGSVIVFWLIYCSGICFAVQAGMELANGSEHHAWAVARTGRLAAVSGFSLIAFLTLFTAPDLPRRSRVRTPEAR
jgi:hypothetical protein